MSMVVRHVFVKRPIRDEGGKTFCVEHTITCDNNRTLQFSERNIFDYGRVINPMYAVAPGLEPGGLCNVRDGVRVWEHFQVEQFCLPDGRIVERDEAHKFVLDTMPVGLPDGYTIAATTVSACLWVDDPEKRVPTLELTIPASDQVWPGQSWRDPDRNRLIEYARDQRAFWIVQGMRVRQSGWVAVRPLDGDEIVALDYLWDRGDFAGQGVRMHTDDDAVEELRVAREEADLDLACEAGQIPGALPADI